MIFSRYFLYFSIFLFLYIASLHNFAADNTFSSFAKSIDSLVKILESESNCDIDWFNEDKMIANPDKFHAILWDKPNSNLTDKNTKIKNQNIRVVSNVKMLEVYIDYKLNFNTHIDKIRQDLKDICDKEKKLHETILYFLNYFYQIFIWQVGIPFCDTNNDISCHKTMHCVAM